MQNLSSDEPLAVAVVSAIRGGDLPTLKALLLDNPSLATASIVATEGYDNGGGTRSLLHIATDWPGRFPDGATIVEALVAAGADVNVRFQGAHTETPLHWAASCDDVAVLDALLDAGADIEAAGAVIGLGSPLADAVAFGKWKAARRLVERGARTTLWQAAALGLMERVKGYLAGESRPDMAPWPLCSPRAEEPPVDEGTHAFWSACYGGQRASAEYLLERGADLNWVGYDGMTALDAARRYGALDLVEWLRGRGAVSAPKS